MAHRVPGLTAANPKIRFGIGKPGNYRSITRIIAGAMIDDKIGARSEIDGREPRAVST
jgi:hypothetical protein